MKEKPKKTTNKSTFKEEEPSDMDVSNYFKTLSNSDPLKRVGGIGFRKMRHCTLK